MFIPSLKTIATHINELDYLSNSQINLKYFLRDGLFLHKNNFLDTMRCRYFIFPPISYSICSDTLTGIGPVFEIL